LLTKVDRRTPLGRRVTELTGIFATAVGGELTPLRRLAVDKAAQLTAIAEKARGNFMRDGIGSPDDIVRLERKADQAIRALCIVETKRDATPSLADYLQSLADRQDADVEPDEREAEAGVDHGRDAADA